MHSSVSTAMAMMAFAGFVYFLSDRISLNALVKSALPLTLSADSCLSPAKDSSERLCQAT